MEEESGKTNQLKEGSSWLGPLSDYLNKLLNNKQTDKGNFIILEFGNLGLNSFWRKPF